MLNDRDLLRVHVEALFTQNPAGQLVRVNEPEGKPAPRFFVGCTPGGKYYWFRHDLLPDVIRELEVLCEAANGRMDEEQAPAEHSSPYEAVLARSEPISKLWSGPAFRFSEAPPASRGPVRITKTNMSLLRPLLDAWCEDVHRGRFLYAVIVDGQAVSVCASVRETPHAHEAGVETALPFRGHGYAVQAVSSWAAAVAASGRIPLFSTSWSNVASRVLARRLGLVQFASDLHIT